MKSLRFVYAIIVIQSLALGYLVLQPHENMAMAQVPDQGAQLQKLIEESHTTNAKLDRIINLMESGKIQVKVLTDKN